MPLKTPWPALQQVIALFFALYWALFLPFICWGAWATPGHPHARPHLVFAMADPVARASAADHHAMQHGAVQDLARCVSGVMPTAVGVEPKMRAQLDACDMAPGPADVAGQSLPSTLASMLLILIVSPAGNGDILPVLQLHPAHVHLFSLDFAVAVPDPPPRVG